MFLLIIVISTVGLSTGVSAIIAHSYREYKTSNTLFLIADLSLIAIGIIAIYWLIF